MQEWKWMEVWKLIQEWNEYRLDGNEGTNQCIIECTTQNVWMKNLCTMQIHAVQSYQKEVNDKYLEGSDIQYTGPSRVTSIFDLST